MEQPPATSPPQRTVTLRQFKENFDELLEAVEHDGIHLIITRDEVPVAVLTSWAYYRTGRERLARLEVAYWSAWRDDGSFDESSLRRPVAEIVEDPAPGQHGAPVADGDTPPPAGSS